MYSLHQPMTDDQRLRRALALRALNRAQRIRRLEALLRKVRAALAVDPAIWPRPEGRGWEAELINEIDEVVE